MSRLSLAIESDYYLDLKVVKNNSKADGVSENIIEVYCMDDDYYPARGIDILVKVNGHAVIKQTGRPTYHGFTDLNGILRIGVVNESAEEVTAAIEVFNNSSTRQEAEIEFIENQGPLKISEVVNVNQTFKQVGEPTSAWPGAEFLIKVTGGSGDINWKVTQSSGEVSVDGTPDGNGVVTIRNRPRQVCQIEGTDNITKEKVTYNFQILNFVNIDKRARSISSASSEYGSNLLRIDECRTLYNQWGNLNRYAVWDTSKYYWTNDKGLTWTTAFNFADGNDKWIGNLQKIFTVYKTGSN